MESQSQVVVVEINPLVDCNHRITELYYHRRCAKNAQICEMKCDTRVRHDVPLDVHGKTTVEVLKQAFNILEEPCEKETENSVRQIHEIEKKAHATIAQKKRQCLNQIQALKKALMMKTYKDLESQLPHLYEKCKSDRFDALNCKEVSWVMQTNRSFHNLKHSQIDSKLLSIIKKFQNFKDVSKNIKPADVIFSKEKAKDVKILEKMPQHIIKVKQQHFTLQRPDYSEDRIRKCSKQLEELNVKRRELEESIKYLSNQKSRLSEEVNNLLFASRQKTEKPKLRIVSQTVRMQFPFQLFFPRWNFQQVRHLDIPIANEQQRQEGGSNWIVPKILFPTSQIFSQQNEGNNNSSKEENLRKSIIREPQNAVIEPQHDKEEENVEHENEEQDQEVSEAQKGPQENLEEKIQQKRMKDNEVMNEQQESVENQVQNHQDQQVSIPKPHDSFDQRLPEQPKVKVQFDEHEGFEPWRNKELLEQMKKFGRSQPQCLKVENIDILKSFSTIRLNPPKSKINPLLKNFSAHNKKPPTPSPLCAYALQLFQQETKRKTENKDKDKTLENN